MMHAHFPQEPDWQVMWSAFHDRYAWIQAMQGCPQDPIHHAEGDVWTHVCLVCEALAELSGWRVLPRAERDLVFWGALLHDVAKPRSTRHESDGRITSPGHSARGARMARRILWELGMPFAEREHIVNLVRYHQMPFWIIEREDPERLVLKISQSVRCDLLALLAEADARGRTCEDQQQILDHIALFEELCREYTCLHAPRSFASQYARFLYFTGHWNVPDVAPYEDFQSRVVLMSGLPGSGKDYWIQSHLPDWPVISLDGIRRELGIAPTDKQGAVIQKAREQARIYLRKGVSFVWNATNTTRQTRGQLVSLFHDYRAHIRIVYVEAARERLMMQNRQRDFVVPQRVLLRFQERWEVPDPYEAQIVDYIVDGH